MSAFALFSNIRALLGQEAAAHESPADAIRDRRAFINEMILDNPGTFTSDLDVQQMMAMFPGRF